MMKCDCEASEGFSCPVHYGPVPFDQSGSSAPVTGELVAGGRGSGRTHWLVKKALRLMEEGNSVVILFPLHSDAIYAARSTEAYAAWDSFGEGSLSGTKYGRTCRFASAFSFGYIRGFSGVVLYDHTALEQEERDRIRSLEDTEDALWKARKAVERAQAALDRVYGLVEASYGGWVPPGRSSEADAP